MIRTLLVGIVLLSTSVAHAGDLEDRAAKVLTEAIDVAKKGDLDAWIKQFCDPERCHTEQSKDAWKAYQLKQLQAQGGFCVDGGKVTVERWRGELGVAPFTAKAYVKCSNRQIPPPVEFRYDKATDKIWIRNTSI
jgi:hypothetical protein